MLAGLASVARYAAIMRAPVRAVNISPFLSCAGGSFL